MEYNLIAYVIFAFTSAITPGPNNVLLFSFGRKYGFKQSIQVMFGIGLGFLSLLYLSGYGISVFLTQNQTIGLVLKIVSSLWLLYLACLIKNLHQVSENKKQRKINFLQAFMMQFINPKAWIMAINGAIVFMPKTESIHLNVLIFSSIFVIIGIPCMITWVLLGNLIAKIISSEKMNIIIGYILSFFILICIVFIWI